MVAGLTRIEERRFFEPRVKRLAAGDSGADIVLYWLGQAGFVVDADGRRLMIYPYLSDTLADKYRGSATPHERMTPPPITPDELGRVDLVLATHHHTDHMDPGTLGPLAKANPALRFVVPRASRAEALKRTGASEAFLDATFAALATGLPEGRRIAYGHVGDGNIHLNVVPPAEWTKEQRYALFRQAEELIFGAVDRFGGSISAEHGIGRSKKPALLQRVDPLTLDLFRTLKGALDPQNLLSPGRIFDL